MVKTRSQASDETEDAAPSVGTVTVTPPETIAGPSCSNLVKRLARKKDPTSKSASPGISASMGTIKERKPRQRQKWSREMNEYIMRCYYTIMMLELTMARKYVYEQFRIKYPEVKVSQQRIADQRRAIERNQLIKQDELDKIKEEITNGNGETPEERESPLIEEIAPHEQNDGNREEYERRTEDRLTEEMRQEFEMAKTEYARADPQQQA